MRDAARDIRPGRFALRRLQLGDVVERRHIAFRLAFEALRRARPQVDRSLAVMLAAYAGTVMPP